MRLIKLSANKSSFHTVNFINGLNLIVGKKKNPDDNNLKNTYNGVGKSLLIELIHFCLASDNVIEFKNKLEDWEFTLDYEIEGINHSIVRKCNDQDKVVYDGNEIKMKDFKLLLGRELFYLDGQKYLSFRSLISRFARRDKGSYSNYFNFAKNETPFQKLINTGYLLGIDVDLIQKKHDLKGQLDSVKETKANIENDEVIKKYFYHNRNNKEINIEIKDLQEKIKKLNSDLVSFKVADNYYAIQERANRIKKELQDCENKIVLLFNDLDSIVKSLVIKNDVSVNLIYSLYEEAGFIMPDQVKKRVDDVVDFHQKLTTTRVKRLYDEKKKIESEIDDRQKIKKELGDKLDESLRYLGEHGALDDFVALSEQCSQLKFNLKKLMDYQSLLKEYKDKVGAFKIKFEQENIKTSEYLENSKNIEKNIDLFRTFSKAFYEDKPGGIIISNNEGINQNRFDIIVKIEDDTSDGINEVKIFCFDLTLLLGSFNHQIGFLIHDSRLFSNMDPRQRATLFDIANNYSKEFNRQYIATINEDNLQPILEYYGKEKYKKVIEKNIILELTDESFESKLLGVQLDIEY